MTTALPAALAVHPAATTTLNINARSLAVSTPTAPSLSHKALRPRLPAVSVITTHLFTYKYDLAPSKSHALATGAIVGIAIGAILGGLLLLTLLAAFIFNVRRRRREQRAMAAGSAFASGITSPITAGGLSTYPASVYSHPPPQNPPMDAVAQMAPGRVGPSNRAGSPPVARNVTPQELPGAHVPFEQHPGFSPSGGRFA
ncbi:MAG: hypothetical protein L6R39_003854 [Caloplaca ligustica]|nr:MAG: hypothetical protein L6R39_003854 [Caloplaca ligustica]